MTVHYGKHQEFSMQRVFEAPPDAVFEAWTRPEYLDWFFNPDNITDAADILETDLAAEMKQAASGLEDADSSNAWLRDSRIGTGTFGAWGEYTAASQKLQTEIRETANEMEWAASMLRAVREDLVGTDQNIGDDFNGVRGKIDTFDNPPPTPVPPGHQQVPYY